MKNTLKSLLIATAFVGFSSMSADDYNFETTKKDTAHKVTVAYKAVNTVKADVKALEALGQINADTKANHKTSTNIELGNDSTINEIINSLKSYDNNKTTRANYSKIVGQAGFKAGETYLKDLTTFLNFFVEFGSSDETIKQVDDKGTATGVKVNLDGELKDELANLKAVYEAFDKIKTITLDEVLTNTNAFDKAVKLENVISDADFDSLGGIKGKLALTLTKMEEKDKTTFDTHYVKDVNVLLKEISEIETGVKINPEADGVLKTYLGADYQDIFSMDETNADKKMDKALTQFIDDNITVGGDTSKLENEIADLKKQLSETKVVISKDAISHSDIVKILQSSGLNNRQQNSIIDALNDLAKKK